MSDGPSVQLADDIGLTTDEAECVLSAWLGAPARCSRIERMHGGMINSVLALSFDRPPYEAVLKLSPADGSPFTNEVASLRHIRDATALTVPEVYAQGDRGKPLAKAYLLIERLPGCNLGSAPLTPADRETIDAHLAELLIELHSHTRPTYGAINEGGCASWYDWFGPVLAESFRLATPWLPPAVRDSIAALLGKTERVLADAGEPTLVHGDIWSNNIMVKRGSAGWRVRGLLDPGALYADVEFELAYMEVFDTVGEAFHRRYREARPMRVGYATRRAFYWLQTMLTHVHVFGDQHYVQRTCRIVDEMVRAGML